MSQLRESAAPAASAFQAGEDLRVLFHRLNTELIELKAVDDVSRTRASEVVAKVLDAMGTAKEIRYKTDLL